jgi:EAL domain-containing protein (putative c-di-GMP-specific phosphodiesterase class I)
MRALHGPDTLLARSGTDSYLAWLPLGVGTLDEAFEAYAVRVSELSSAVTSGSTSAPTQPRIGVCAAPEDGTDAQTLIAHAEIACVAAVRLAQPKPVRYSPSLLADAQSRDRLAGEIAQGIERAEFELFYQPLVSPLDAHLRKAEGLIRWRHPVRGLVPPGAFIPLAEQSDLIIGLTDWVLEEAVRQVKVWLSTLHPDFQISVNMPPAYLALCVRDPGRMLERLQALQVPPGALVLEITEGVMLEVTPELLQVLSLLRALGFQIALDDFGVGYSSFGQIDKLKLDFLKLDKSFVDDLGAREERGPICEAIVTMAHRLGFKVVAEGVETELQRAHLVQMGTDYLQGYIYSKPVPVADLEAWAARQQAAA